MDLNYINMKIKDKNLSKLFSDCFEHLGVEVSYCNKSKKEISKIKALVKRPDNTYSLGADGALIQQIASIEIRCRDVTFLNVGDYIKIGNKYYKIFEQPLQDSSNELWKVAAVDICLI
ncbi:MAG: hypothetical protein MUP48_02700 [Wolbachia endosymbiont of Homalodisca vitripennis]|nr:hypothetical protein [Wolbachia endosymbiont of Homalodisca vitripennis]MCJ7476366.1 hypothetical protein [Wolbachia endosymbiont of Homalodisca vitripennis]